MDDCVSMCAEPVKVTKDVRPDLPEDTVTRVTSADFNGKTFGDLPLDPLWTWVIDAVNSEEIRIEPSDTDYAVWAVDTPDGCKLAWPGDFIALSPLTEALYVIQDESNINREVG